MPVPNRFADTRVKLLFQLINSSIFSFSLALACAFARPKITSRLSIYSSRRTMRFTTQKDRAEISLSFRHNMLQFSYML